MEAAQVAGFRVELKNDEVLTFRGARSSGMRSAGRFAVRL